MSSYTPFDIQTEAGKQLWHKMNQHYGSSVWGPVGEGIEAIEAEMRKQIVEAWDEGWDAGASWPQPYKWDNPYRKETE